MDLQMKPPEPIRFTFDERKAAAAAALLLELHGGRMEYLRLMKLLYLAERESLARFGRPIAGDEYISMKLGPVLSHVLNLMKEVDPRAKPGPWVRQIAREGYSVTLRGAPDLGPLSDAEISLLREAATLYRELDKWHLSRFTHGLPEWKDPGNSTIEIAPDEILRAMGVSEATIAEIREDTQHDANLDKIFGKR